MWHQSYVIQLQKTLEIAQKLTGQLNILRRLFCQVNIMRIPEIPVKCHHLLWATLIQAILKMGSMDWSISTTWALTIGVSLFRKQLSVAQISNQASQPKWLTSTQPVSSSKCPFKSSWKSQSKSLSNTRVSATR